MISKRLDKSPTHVRNYYKAFGFDESSFIPCEVCGAKSDDIHHVEPRSSFGSKFKRYQDHHSNLVALCRLHHERAHGINSRLWKQRFKEIIEQRS